jgi:hypothetical protein
MDAVTTVNTCAPEVVVYVAGSSALGAAITATFGSLFDAGTVPIRVNDASAAGYSKGVDIAFFGIRNGRRTLIAYNPMNGSGAGVSQLMSKTKSSEPSTAVVAKATSNIPESRVVHVGPLSRTLANTCTSDLASTTWPASVNCSYLVDRQADLAISDVRVQELAALYPQVTKSKFSELTQFPLGMQGFGITVNWRFYQALQTAQIAAGTLPPTCVAGDTTAACQPSIRSVDYSSLVTNRPGFGPTKGAGLFIDGDTTPLLLARRDIYSGTQAVSNMYFANGACGIVPTKSTNLGGALALTTAADTPGTSYTVTRSGLSVIGATATIPASGFGVVELLVNGDVTALQRFVTDAYVIGVVNVRTRSIVANNYNFVKLDGVSPNFLGASPAVKGRAGWVDGTYPIAVTSYAVIKSQSLYGAHSFVAWSEEKRNLVYALIETMRNPANNLDGIAYLSGGTWDADDRMAKAVRGFDGNNCSPLVRR